MLISVIVSYVHQKSVFSMALLHPRAALLQNSTLEQLYSGVLVVFGKIGVHSFRK
jgi:hypothetical protein